MAIEILIVDDNSDIRNILNELILDADTRQGLQQIIIRHFLRSIKMPDVAILDVKLDKGDNDGIELLSI